MHVMISCSRVLKIQSRSRSHKGGIHPPLLNKPHYTPHLLYTTPCCLLPPLQIMLCRTWPEAYALFCECSHVFNNVNINALLGLLAKLVGNRQAG